MPYDEDLAERIRELLAGEGGLIQKRGTVYRFARHVQPLKSKAPVRALIEDVGHRPGVALLGAEVVIVSARDAEYIVARA